MHASCIAHRPVALSVRLPHQQSTAAATCSCTPSSNHRLIPDRYEAGQSRRCSRVPGQQIGLQLRQRVTVCQARQRGRGGSDWASTGEDTSLRLYDRCNLPEKHLARLANTLFTAGNEEEAVPSPQLSGKLESTSIPQALRKQVEDAVEALGGRVTVGDVAARAGASLEDTERTLNALAADSQGVLQVCSRPGSCTHLSLRDVLVHASQELIVKGIPNDRGGESQTAY